MPLFRDETGSRYRTLEQLRDAPANSEEEAYQRLEVDNEIDRILSKHEKTPNFTKQLAMSLARRVLELDNEKQQEQGLQ